MKRGFTLIELMVVMAIIAILSTIALFGISKAQASARDVSRQQMMKGTQAALERFYGDYGGYPYTNGLDNGNRFYYLNYILVGCPGTPQWAPNWCPSYGSNYLGATWGGTPVDPQTKTWVCSGPTGNGPCTIGGAVYDYTGSNCGTYTCQSYTLTLTKEAGGTVTFKSPQ